MTQELVKKLINILDIDPNKGEWLTSAMAKSSFPEPFAETLYKQLVDKKLDTYLDELDWLSKHLVRPRRTCLFNSVANTRGWPSSFLNLYRH